MAKSKICAVLDLKVSAYVNPHFCRSTGEAIREFTAACEDPKSQLARFPGDFQLFELGEFDDSNGAVFSLAKPVLLGLASEYIKRPDSQVPTSSIVKGM